MQEVLQVMRDAVGAVLRLCELPSFVQLLEIEASKRYYNCVLLCGVKVVSVPFFSFFLLSFPNFLLLSLFCVCVLSPFDSDVRICI